MFNSLLWSSKPSTSHCLAPQSHHPETAPAAPRRLSPRPCGSHRPERTAWREAKSHISELIVASFGVYWIFFKQTSPRDHQNDMFQVYPSIASQSSMALWMIITCSLSELLGFHLDLAAPVASTLPSRAHPTAWPIAGGRPKAGGPWLHPVVAGNRFELCIFFNIKKPTSNCIY